MTHIYIAKSSDMWCIHHYGLTEVNMHLDFLGPLNHNECTCGTGRKFKIVDQYHSILLWCFSTGGFLLVL